MSNISKIQLPSGNNYDLKDKNVPGLIDRSAKNLLEKTYTSGSSTSGISWTVDNDGVVTVSGTNSGSSRAEINLTGDIYTANRFVGKAVSGVSGGSETTYSIIVIYSNNGSTWAAEDNITDGFGIVKNYPYIRICIAIRANATVTNKVFYPMICTVADYEASPVFEPYALDNPTLTKRFSLQEIRNVSVFDYIDSLPTGVHWFYNEANQSVTDTPENINSTVYYTVYKSSDNTIDVSAYLPSVNYGSNTYLCSKTSGVWHTWNTFGAYYGNGRIWSTNSGIDLDKVTMPGKYMTTGTSASNAVTNKPPYSNPGGKCLMVEVVHFAENTLIQKCYVYRGGDTSDTGTMEMYMRMYTGGAWKMWNKVDITVVT